MSKAIKLLLTELVGQCRNILPSAFPALTDAELLPVLKYSVIFLLAVLKRHLQFCLIVLLIARVHGAVRSLSES